MLPAACLRWPFFTREHQALAERVDAWAKQHVHETHERAAVDETCKALVRDLGKAGILSHCIQTNTVRALAIIRETLAWHDALADFAFAMQGLGSGALSLA